MRLYFQSSPTVSIASNIFTNVPVILKYEETPLIEVIQEQDIGFTTQIPVYHEDGTYLAKVRGNRIYPTEAGKKAKVDIRDTPGKFICSLEGKAIFELSHGTGYTFKADAELFAPDGYFLKCAKDTHADLFDKSQIKVGGLSMTGCSFQNLSVGIWFRRDGTYAIGIP